MRAAAMILALALAGCAVSPPSVRVVPYPVSRWVEVPRTLTQPHEVPVIAGATNADLLSAYLSCVAELEQANSDKQRIRGLNADQAKDIPAAPETD